MLYITIVMGRVKCWWWNHGVGTRRLKIGKASLGTTHAPGPKHTQLYHSPPTNDSPYGRMNRPDTSNNLEANSEQSKVHRPKAPVDIEKQCSVTLASGSQCARSLTCTRHGMSAKRAVPGRSAPFDQLLAEYQREN